MCLHKNPSSYINCSQLKQYTSVLQAAFVSPKQVEDVLYPPDIDPAQRSEFGSAQSIVPSSFLIEQGAKGMFVQFFSIIMCLCAFM
jgi:hypothetical protein